MRIGGRDYPTPLVFGGVAGVLVLVAGQRLLGSRNADAGPAAPEAGRPAGSDGLDGQNDLGQFPAPGNTGNDGSFDWWDNGGDGSASLPGVNDPGAPLPPTPIAPAPGGIPTGSTPPPASTIPAGTVAKVTLRSGSYQTAIVSGSRFVRYGPNHAGGFSAWAGRPIKLTDNGGTWFMVLSGNARGTWFARYDPRITWQPL